MRQPSRRMPPAPSKTLTLPGSWVLALLGVGLVVFLWQWPVMLGGLGVIVFLTVLLKIDNNERLAALAADRPGESICSFARSFGRRAVDTWVIRAVFEELQPHVRFGDGVLPLRGFDELEGTLAIDPDDLEDLTIDMAFRARRSLEDADKNPLYGKVVTVADLVLFLENQPPRSAA